MSEDFDVLLQGSRVSLDRQCTRESRKFASEYLCLVGELSKICVNSKRRGHGGKNKVGQDN